MNDAQLIEISRGVDSYISTLMLKYEISPLSLAAILLARTMLLNKEAGSMEDLLKLLNSVTMDSTIERNKKVH